LVLVLV
jgi:hypothetical protein